MEQLSKERLARNELKAQLDRLKEEHNKCDPLIAALRKQIKETKEALDLEDLQQLEDTKVKAVQESKDLERQLAKPRVKLGAAAPGHVVAAEALGLERGAVRRSPQSHRRRRSLAHRGHRPHHRRTARPDQRSWISHPSEQPVGLDACRLNSISWRWRAAR